MCTRARMIRNNEGEQHDKAPTNGMYFLLLVQKKVPKKSTLPFERSEESGHATRGEYSS